MDIEITEVILRDGLQDEPVIVSTDDKIRVLDALIHAGVRAVELVSFVNPKKLPQMADAERLCARAPSSAGMTYSTLALNPRGVERAALMHDVAVNVVVSASPAHSLANSGRSTEQALHEIREMVRQYPQLDFTAAVSTAFTFPVEGLIEASAVVDIVGHLQESGISRIGLADTIGDAAPEWVARTVAEVLTAFPRVEFSLHLHDALGQVMETIDLALELGIRRFDSALGGYGGCPYAPGAHGNVSTEELVGHLHAGGHSTGIDLHALAEAREVLEHALARAVPVAESTGQR